MSKNLFSDFEEVTAKQWKQKIQYDLKGADYNESVVWNSRDGIDVKPFYHPEETPAPFSLKPPATWNICEKIFVVSAEKGNKAALEALAKGAESIFFIVSKENIAPEILLAELDLANTPVFLEFRFHSADYFSELRKALEGKEHQVRLQVDIIGKLARTGNWFSDLKQDHEILDGVFLKGESFKSVLSVNAGLYQNAGASIPQQLAYALAHVNEYLNHYYSGSRDANSPASFSFKVSVGSNYFFEIAKIRALRLLFSSLAKEYGLPENCHIIAEPSKRNKTLYDYNVNLLRTTTECMSAVLGGADSICNMPYDALYHKQNDFSSRIARNQLLILKNESYFAKVANPAEGSYYIESLTQQFAEKALEIFKDIEKGGGFLKQLKEGTIQKKIAESAGAEQEAFDEGELILIGSNKYPNPEDKMQGELEIHPFLKKNPRRALLPPILEKRLAERLEQDRLEEEKATKAE